jgi:hypothetical protein
MPDGRILKLKVPLPRGGIVDQSVKLFDFSFSSTGPIEGRTNFSLRYFLPGPQVVHALFEETKSRITSEQRAGRSPTGPLYRTYAQQIAALYLRPESELERRRINFRFLEKWNVRGYYGWGPFETRAIELMPEPDKGDPVDLESELVEALVDMTPAVLQAALRRAQKHERHLLYEAVAQHNRAWTPSDDHVGILERVPLDDALARSESHRIHQHLARLLGDNDKEARRAFAYSLTLEGDEIVDQANRLTLAALHSALDSPMTDAERRAFAFFHSKRSVPVHPLLECEPWFNGIVAAQPFLMSVLQAAPRIFAHLAATYFFRAWPPSERHAEKERTLRFLIGLLRAGKAALSTWRREECEQKRRQRRGQASIGVPPNLDLREEFVGCLDRGVAPSVNESEEDQYIASDLDSIEDERLALLERELAKLPALDRRIFEERRRGEKWAQIAEAVGLRRYQSAQKRFERVVRDLKKGLQE